MSWIKQISQGIEKAFQFARPAQQFAPALLYLYSLYQRPGLSAIALTAAIISRLAEAGIDSGVNPDGSPNKTCQFIRIMCEEIVKEIKDNLVIQTIIEPGTIVSTGTVMTPFGPGTATVTNTTISSARGIGH